MPNLKINLIILLFALACKSSVPSVPSNDSVLDSKEQDTSTAIVHRTSVSPPTDPSQFPYAVNLKDKNKSLQKSYEVLPQSDKPIVMLFWLTTCTPCARELQTIQEKFKLWQEDTPFHLVALSMDREENYPAFIQRVTSEQWPFPAYWDFNREFKALMPGNLNGLPQTFIFDKKGKLTWSKRGYLPGDEIAFFDKIKEAAKS